jgi:predicted nucleic acid-binding protein
VSEYLIDTSVWIDFFNGKDARQVKILKSLIEGEEDVCLTDIIIAETLQGFKSDTDYLKAKRHLLSFKIYSLKTFDSYIAASQIYRTCRKNGMTLRGTVDCLIAQTAIENELLLLHNDHDFDLISKVSKLKTVKLQ